MLNAAKFLDLLLVVILGLTAIGSSVVLVESALSRTWRLVMMFVLTYDRLNTSFFYARSPAKPLKQWWIISPRYFGSVFTP
ncbi:MULTISPECIES: hypothetical protein [unclassified Nostoc]|uniref:hypothetical protein n=1 Tax=unclassified Nostoc TaxID=2593658 RepID=UPI002AD3C451|nr:MULTISPECIES: hypothetical protein [unclassified Nostoc]MDZ8125785.1 hypothetical protein [Nostoc sp. CmiVER01]MDZ8224292.1 hypothetical protein [Nostoc sp. ChiVER01]